MKIQLKSMNICGLSQIDTVNPCILCIIDHGYPCTNYAKIAVCDLIFLSQDYSNKFEKTPITYKKLSCSAKGFLFVRLSVVIYFLADEIARENCICCFYCYLINILGIWPVIPYQIYNIVRSRIADELFQTYYL